MVVLAICLPLRLDAPLAYLAANISLPFFAPFLSFAEIEMGSWLRTGHALPIAVETLRTHAAKAFLGDLVLGTLVLSPACAAVGGTVTFVLATAYRRRRPVEATPSAFAQAVDRVAARYARGRRSSFYYVRSKLSADPVARAIASAGPLGVVTDVGCGRGQLAILLLEMDKATRATGFDWDAGKVKDAQDARADLPATFEVGDVRSHPVVTCDTALLIDVLHYLDDEEQDLLLRRVAGAARERIFVREIDPDRGWRSAVTRLQELVTTRLRFNVGARVRARPIRTLSQVLKAEGFAVTDEPCWGRTPFANVLVVATRAPKVETPAEG